MSGELRPLTDDLLDGAIAAQSYSFAVEREMVPRWFERAGKDNVRCWVDGGRIAGALINVPMGMWFGGRSVKNLGIAGVAIPPEARGRGHAYEMMAATMREARRAGLAISTLYPATISLYRKVGYELAGGHYDIDLALDSLTLRASEGEIVSVGPADIETLSAVQRSVASAHDGNLDRGPYIWSRVFAPRFQETRGFAASFGGSIEGYCVLRAQPGAHPPFHELAISDLAARTPRALRRLASFLGDHRSVARRAHWTGGPHDPLLSLLPEKTYEVRQHEHWMLRIVDVKAALEARGYRVDRAIGLELDIDDPEVPENCGRLRVEVEDGSARVVSSRGGSAIRAKIGGLSALYSGYQPASALAQLGFIEGDSAALAAADRIFVGSTPWMSEMF